MYRMYFSWWKLDLPEENMGQCTLKGRLYTCTLGLDESTCQLIQVKRDVNGEE